MDAAILLAKELEAKGKDYRIISPYATQSSKILAKLKEEDMKWEDKCFNVDSFQVMIVYTVYCIPHSDRVTRATRPTTSSFLWSELWLWASLTITEEQMSPSLDAKRECLC